MRKAVYDHVHVQLYDHLYGSATECDPFLDICGVLKIGDQKTIGEPKDLTGRMVAMLSRRMTF